MPQHSLSAMFRNRFVWLLALIFFSFNIGYYGINFWLPSIIKSSGVQDDFAIGLLAAVPYIFGAVCMLWNSRHSDLKQERRWHIAIPAIVGAIGLTFSALNEGSTFWMMAWICVAMSGTLSLIPTYISLRYIAFRHGSGGRYRVSELYWQSGWLLWPNRSWLAERHYRQHQQRTVYSGGISGALRTAYFPHSGTID